MAVLPSACRHGRQLLVLIFANFIRVSIAQFGGGGFGGYTPPAPICPAHPCPSGQKAVGKPEVNIISYGCKDSGMNILSMGKDFDPNNPYASMNQKGKNLNKCCIERDICKQTCGMTSKDCHDAFQKCQTKICKGDQNCQLQAMLSDISGDPYDTQDSYLEDKDADPTKAKCRGYNAAQAANCQCVAKGEVEEQQETNLKAFYSKFNSEKLDKDGNIKDAKDVWKKWKGKEPSMFMALAQKYKEKVVTMKEKPKPPPYKPPAKKGEEDETSETVAEEDASDAPPPADEEGEAFEKQLKDVLKKKNKARDEEDFDLADEMKEKEKTLKMEEITRLKAKKAAALEAENFLEAKSLKNRIAKLEL